MSERTRRLLRFLFLVVGVFAMTWLAAVVADITWTEAQVTLLWGIGIWLMWDRLVERGERQ